MPDKTFEKDSAAHEKAFNVYYESRNKALAGREVGITYATVCHWAEKTYPCRFGCPYHGWDDLVAEKERALAAHVGLINQGEYNPLKHEEVMKAAAGNPNAARMIAVNKLVRSDLERIGHYEYLYAKVYFHLTRRCISIDPTKTFDELHEEDMAVLSEQLNQGLVITNFESGMRCLNSIVDKIKQMKADAGVEQERDKEGSEEITTIVELRKLRKVIRHATPDQIPELMRKADSLVIDEPVPVEKSA